MVVSWVNPPKTKPAKQPGYSVLAKDFTYHSERLGGEVTIEAPFTFDWDSVPRLPIVYLVFKGRARIAALIHDDLYCKQPVSRRVADLVFLDAMVAEKIPFYFRWPKYLGVRAGGWIGWRRNRRTTK